VNADTWLQQNAIDCQRFTARISPAACARYREEKPDSCKGCAGHDAQPLPKVRRHRSASVVPLTLERPKKTEGNEVAKNRVDSCAECQQTRTIIGRGLCGNCYGKLKRKGQLDAKYPLTSPVRTKKPMKRENIEPEDVCAQACGNPQRFEKVGALLKDAVPVEKKTTEKIDLQGHAQEITLNFQERDQDLFTALKDWAECDRRTPEAQILHLLDDLVKKYLARAAA